MLEIGLTTHAVPVRSVSVAVSLFGLAKMPNLSNAFKYGLVMAVGVVSWEIARYCYTRWSEWHACPTRRSISSAVIWTNELSQTCNHSQDSRDAILLCTNKFCYLGNIRRLVGYIDSARCSIDLCMYVFTSHELGSALQRAHQRGVKVRVIVDEEMTRSSNSQTIALNINGISVRCDNISTMLMHHKFCVIDGAKRVSEIVNEHKKEYSEATPVLIAGSTNWTYQGLSGNWDFLLCTSDRVLLAEFEREFERMWKRLNRGD